MELLQEDLISLSEVARRMPPLGGVPVSPSTVFRWADVGCRGRDGARVTLETCKVGGRRCTSTQAVSRFQERLNVPRGKAGKLKTDRQRKRAHERAEKELAEMGY